MQEQNMDKNLIDIDNCNINCTDVDSDLRSLFLCSPISLFLTDGNARLVKVSKALADFFGQNADDMENKLCGAAFACIHSEDDPAGCGFGPFCKKCVVRKAIENTYITGKQHRNLEAVMEIRNREHKNERRIFRISTSRIKLSNQNCVLVCMDDITEHKLTEDDNLFLADAIRLSSQAFGVGYPDGRLGLTNPAFCSLVGYTEEELKNVDWNLLLTPPKWREHESKFLQKLRDSGKPVHYEKEYIHKDGTLIPIEMLAHLKTDDKGNPLYYYAFINDLRERKKAEKVQKSLEDQLHQAQKLESIGRLAGGIAHDFNNLLSIILGYGELLLNSIDKDEPFYAQMEHIYEAGVKAKDLTRQLLAFSRKQVLEMSIVDINTVISNFEKMLRRLIGEDVIMQLMLTDQKLYIKADPAQLEQVLMNLSLNAKDAMPDGGTLTISTKVVEIDEDYINTHPHPYVSLGSYALLSICDTGSGIDKDNLSHIFEPFFTTKDVDRGTGLGLATCYGIVKQHGGNIFVYSEIGHGSIFNIYLPLNHEKYQLQSSSKRIGLPKIASATVLVVEDDEPVRKVTCLIMKAHGYNVIESENVFDAIFKAESYQDPIHLVLTDVIMPKMKGPEVVDNIKKYHPESKVLYMSGYTEDVIVSRGILKAGVQYIRKPFTNSELLNKCHNVIYEM